VAQVNDCTMEVTAGTLAENAAGVNRWAVRFLPSLTDLVFLLPFFLLYSVLPGSKLLLGDADMGWHIRTGEWILDHHAVPVRDLFSYTKPGAPWFAWEWAWDVLFGAIHRFSGLAGVVTVNLCILGLISVLTFRLVRRACGNDLLAFVLTGVAICGSTLHWLARPHLLSWLFFLLFAHVLIRAEKGRTRLLWFLPVLMVLWTNMHGTFIFGLSMVFIAAVAPWTGWVFYGGDPLICWRQCKPFLYCLAACIAATFANPYGWQLHQHILHYMADSRQLDIMQEFQSISFHHAPAPLFEAMLLLGGAALMWCVQRRQWSGALTLLLWAHLALFAIRSIPMYLFLSAPWIGCMLAELLRSKESRAVRWVATRLSRIGTELHPLERIERFHLASAAGLLFTVANIATGHPGFEARFDGKSFPESAVREIDRLHPERIFAKDQWSAYLIYRRFPAIKVFIDDRSDFYGADMLDRVAQILGARWDWEADLLRFSTDMVIVAPDTPLSTVLKGSPRWQLVLDDKSVVVFTRKQASSVAQARPVDPAKKVQPLLTTEEAGLGLKGLQVNK
jgi:hypothetical protein